MTFQALQRRQHRLALAADNTTAGRVNNQEVNPLLLPESGLNRGGWALHRRKQPIYGFLRPQLPGLPGDQRFPR